MVEFIMYKDDNDKTVIGECSVCGRNIYRSEDHYKFRCNVLVCSECKDEYVIHL